MMQDASCMLHVARCQPSTALSGEKMRFASIEGVAYVFLRWCCVDTPESLGHESIAEMFLAPLTSPSICTAIYHI
jgi:hypothetical protein